jgi:hypothetical protein
LQHWNPNKTLQKWRDGNMKKSADLVFSNSDNLVYLYQEGDSISVRELESIIVKSAELVVELGEDYLKLFLRAERELKIANEKLRSFQRAQSVLLE